MKSHPILLLALFVMGCGGASKLKYAEKLFGEKAYKEAADVCATLPENDANAQLILARSQYHQLKMDECVAAFSRVPAESLNDDDRMMYAEALRQTGAVELAASIAAGIPNTSGYLADAKAIGEAKRAIPYPGIKLEPLSMNSENSELLPFYYQGKLFYLTDARKKFTPQSNFRWNGKPFLQIEGDSGVVNVFKKFNTDVHDGPLTANENVQRVVFNRSVPTKSKTGRDVVSLFEKNTAELASKKSKQLPFCDAAFNYMHPFFNDAGSKLYFASDKAGGIGGMDIYYSELTAEGTWGEPYAMGNINTAADEVYPTMLGDSILVFSSQRATGLGGLDLYSCTLRKDGSWSEPRVLDAPVNSTRDDFHLIPHMDGNNKYLVTSNSEGNDNIYEVTIPNDAKGGWEIQMVDSKSGEVLKNKDLTLLYELTTIERDSTTTDEQGKVKANPLGATLNVLMDGYKQSQAVYAAPRHSFFTTLEEKVEMNQIFNFDVKGKISDGTTGNGLSNATVIVRKGEEVDTLKTDDRGNFLKNISMVGGKDSTITVEILRDGYAPKTIEGIAINSGNTQVDLNALADLSMSKINEGDELGSILSINSIYFETAKWNITPEGAVELDKIANLLLYNPSLTVECGSHTDCRGTQASNQKLSANRAQSTVDYMMQKGVSKSQLRFKGYGEDKPVNNCRCEGATPTTCSEEELALNRRTEFRVLKSLIKDDQTVEELEIATTVQGEYMVSGEVEPTDALPAIESDNFELGASIVYGPEAVLKQTIPGGKLFMVQIGAFTGKADNSFFNGVTPIRVELTDLGFTRYLAGMFTSYEKAEAAMLKLKEKGFVDAFIVGYVNGKRIALQEITKE
jgi:outer membrane protein OmpA-like peptidoglycan-associated protein